MLRSPDLPPLLYYGTFWPADRKSTVEGLTGRPQIATTEIKDWAWYFAHNARWKNKTQAGIITVYRIETQRLSASIANSAIPPEGRSPFLIGIKGWDEELQVDRLLMREWNFDRIPWSAAFEEDIILDAPRPGLDLTYVGAHRPSGRRIQSLQNQT